MKRSELRALIAEEIQYVLKGGTVNEDTVTLKKMNDINHTRLVKWLHNQFADKYAAALKSLDAASTKGNFTMDVSNWDKKDIAVLKKYLKSQDYMFEGTVTNTYKSTTSYKS